MARRKRRSRSRRKRMPAGLARYWAGKRRRKSNPNPPRRRRRSRSRSRIYSNPRRRSRRRSYRRNPAMAMGGILPSTGLLFDAVYLTGGFIGTKMLAGTVLPMLGGMAAQPIVRIIGKGVLAGILGWGIGSFMNKKAGQLVMLGGLVETVNDAVQTYVAPIMPGLLPAGMGVYPSLGNYESEGMGLYPQLSGMVDEQFDEAV